MDQHLHHLSRQEKLNRLRLFRSENIGPTTFHHLLARYGSAEEAIREIPDLVRQGGRKKPLELCSLAAAETEWQRLESLGGQFIFHNTPDYPTLLAHIETAPPVLSILGNSQLLKEKIIGIVGGRNASLNGRRLAHRFATILGEENFTIASGMARGIDTAVHEGSLSSGTIAILAGGIDIIYPTENKKLYEQIKSDGALLSEMPLNSQPQARHFPRRNRIISGLSEGVLVVEAALRSGSLITARHANEQGRDVFAVPGSPLDMRARGCNNLIRNGAILTETPNDILHILHYSAKIGNEADQYPVPSQIQEQAQNQMNAGELDQWRQQLLDLLSEQPIAVDTVIRQLQAPASHVICLIMELEIAGLLCRHSGNRIAKAGNGVPF